MPSKASSLNHASGPNPAARYLFFKRDLKDNGVWLFVLSLLFLLAEPFILYLTGATAADLSNNQLWGSQMARAFKDFTEGVQSIVLASLMVLGLTFLAYRLFTFLFDKEESNFYLSLPLSRSRLFVNRYMAGVVLITLAFLVELLVMLLAFFLPPANLAPYFQDWLSLRLNFYLASLAFFSSLVCCFTLVGHFADGILTALGLNLFLPLLLALLGIFITDSVAGYLPEPGNNFDRIVSLWSPGMQLYIPRRGLTDGLYSLAAWMVWGCLCLLAFRRRPAERAGSRLSSMPHSWPLSLLYTFLGGVLGGMFIEALTGRQIIYYFLAGFVLFSCLAHLLYQVMVQGPLKGAGRSFAVKVLAALILMVAFDLAVETYPAEAPRYWQAEDVDSADLELGQIPSTWSILQKGPVSLHIDRKTAPESLFALLKAYQEGPHLSERQGFINDSRMRDPQGDYQSFNSNLRLEFTRQSGRKDKVQYFYRDSQEIYQALRSSDVYQPLTVLENRDYQAGDKVYLELTLYDDGSGQTSFRELVDRLDSSPYFQEDSWQEDASMPVYYGNPWSGPGASPAKAQLPSRKGGQAYLLLREEEAEKLVQLINADLAQTAKYAEFWTIAEPLPSQVETGESFDQQLTKMWSGLDVNLRLFQLREISLPGLSVRADSFIYNYDGDPVASELDTEANLALDSLRLEQNLPIHEPFQEESQAYLLQLLQGVAHD